MIRQVLMLGAGAAAGWIGHRAFGRGRDAAAVKAEEALRTTLHPSTLGRHAGAATATLLAEGARGFAAQLREEVPAWKSVSDRLQGTDSRTITGEAVEPSVPSRPAAGRTTPTDQTPTEEQTA